MHKRKRLSADYADLRRLLESGPGAMRLSDLSHRLRPGRVHSVLAKPSLVRWVFNPCVPVLCHPPEEPAVDVTGGRNPNDGHAAAGEFRGTRAECRIGFSPCGFFVPAAIPNRVLFNRYAVLFTVYCVSDITIRLHAQRTRSWVLAEKWSALLVLFMISTILPWYSLCPDIPFLVLCDTFQWRNRQPRSRVSN